MRKSLGLTVRCAALPVAMLSAATTVSADAFDAAVVFTAKCASCHNFGTGDRVGPDLKGITQRRDRSWLVAWIQSSDALIRKGDRAAVELFARYRQQRMPDHELSEVQIGALLDYLAADGPEAAERLRRASTATPAEIARGEHLFYGKVRLTSGGVACGACHSLSKQRALGASLAPDLGKAYAEYRDKGLSQTLNRPCFPRVPALTTGVKVVTEDESLALRAFLRAASFERPQTRSANGEAPKQVVAPGE